MSNQHKKYNAILIGFCLLATITAVYFGIKSQNLSQELSSIHPSLKAENPAELDDGISKIDSLLFKGDYKYAYEISKELKQSQYFANDSTLLLRYNLISEIVESKKEPNNNASYASNKLSNNTSEVLQTKLDSVSKKLIKAEQSIANEANNPHVITKTIKTSEYLTFKTTKGTDLHYIGSIKNQTANGFGVALLESGSRYEGQWKNNVRHGYGKFIWDDGDYYEGAYENDKRSGMGTYHWKNGEKYIGEWKDDKRNGHGEFFNKKGKLKTSGNWENDVLIKQDEKEKKH